jgi:hypothetical protein
LEKNNRLLIFKVIFIECKVNFSATFYNNLGFFYITVDEVNGIGAAESAETPQKESCLAPSTSQVGDRLSKQNLI